MSKPTIAAKTPVKVSLQQGKKYFFCTCGLSGKQPFCDGSHKESDFAPHMFEAEKDGDAWLCMCKMTGGKPFCDGSHNKLAEE